MSADPLATLLTEMEVALMENYTPERLADEPLTEQQANWLRANRDRVLEALGGERLTYELVADCANYEDPRPVWVFPEGPVE